MVFTYTSLWAIDSELRASSVSLIQIQLNMPIHEKISQSHRKLRIYALRKATVAQ